MKVVNVKSMRILGANGFLRAVFEAFRSSLLRRRPGVDLRGQRLYCVELFPSSRRTAGGFAKLGEVEVEENKAIICLVGKDISGRAGIAASVFDTIAAANVNVHMISQGASEINIGFVIEEHDVPEAVRQLHQRFFEMKPSSRAARLPAGELGMQAFPQRISARAEVG